MYKFPIGVMLESFRTDYEVALEQAVRVGAQGIQVHAFNGELSARNLSNDKAKLFLSQVRDAGLDISGLVADLMLHDKTRYPQIMDESKRVMDLAMELGTNIVTTHIGVIPADQNHDRFKLMQEACFELAEYANKMDAHYAIETGPEIATTLKGFLDPLPGTGFAVNLDPANFVMVTGDNPVEAVYTLKDYIVHTHAKDGRKNFDIDPEVLYGMHGTVEEEIQNAKAFVELPLGQGDVDFDAYLKALDDINYKGYLTIEREVGDNPEADILAAVNFLKQKTNQ